MMAESSKNGQACSEVSYFSCIIQEFSNIPCTVVDVYNDSCLCQRFNYQLQTKLCAVLVHAVLRENKVWNCLNFLFLSYNSPLCFMKLTVPFGASHKSAHVHMLRKCKVFQNGGRGISTVFKFSKCKSHIFTALQLLCVCVCVCVCVCCMLPTCIQ